MQRPRDEKTHGMEHTVKTRDWKIRCENFPSSLRRRTHVRRAGCATETDDELKKIYRIRDFNSSGISREVNSEMPRGLLASLGQSLLSPFSPFSPSLSRRILWLRTCFLAENRRPPERASSEFRPPKYFPHFHFYS